MTDQPATINLLLNGEPASLPAGATVQDMLTAKGIAPQNIAVEHNGAIVPKSAYASTALHEADRLEIIGFIGGG